MENDKIKEKLNEIHKLQNIKNKEWEKLRKKYQKYVDEYNEKVKDLCDFVKLMLIMNLNIVIKCFNN